MYGQQNIKLLNCSLWYCICQFCLFWISLFNNKLVCMLTNIQHKFPSNELGVFGREGPAARVPKVGGWWISELLFASKETYCFMDFVCSFCLLSVALNLDGWNEYAKVSSHELVWNSFYQLGSAPTPKMYLAVYGKSRSVLSTGQTDR